jgi:hypothetical protein
MNAIWASLSNGDKIKSLLLVLTFLGVVAAFRQIREGARAQRALFLKDLLLALRGDSEASNVFYLIDHGHLRWPFGDGGCELERQVDRLLTLLNLVCEMNQQGILSKREMRHFRYYLDRVGSNKAIKRYVQFLNSLPLTNEAEARVLRRFKGIGKKRL